MTQTTIIPAHPDSPLGKARAKRDELAPKLAEAEQRLAALRSQLAQAEVVVKNVTAITEPAKLAEAMALQSALKIIVGHAERDHRTLLLQFQNVGHSIGTHEHNIRNFDVGLANVAAHWHNTPAHRNLKMQRLALTEPEPPGGWHVDRIRVD